jgi:hypothetical protein
MIRLVLRVCRAPPALSLSQGRVWCSMSPRMTVTQKFRPDIDGVVGSLQIPGKQLEKRALLVLSWGGESAKQPGMVNVLAMEKSSIIAYEGEPLIRGELSLPISSRRIARKGQIRGAWESPSAGWGS